MQELSKEDKKILMNLFVNECMSQVYSDGKGSLFYEDNGGAVFHESHLDEYFKLWFESLSPGEVDAYISEYPGNLLPSPNVRDRLTIVK